MYRPDDDGGVLTIMNVLNNASTERPYDFGLVAESITGSAQLTLSNSPCDGNQECTTLRIAGPEGSTVVMTDSSKHYHYRRMERRSPDGKLKAEWIASDYRLISGLWVPFRREDRIWSSEGQMIREKVITLQSAELNRGIPESKFSIEIKKGEHIVTELERGAYSVGAPVTVTLTSAPNIAHLIQASPIK